jgi:hypothetical protein
MVMDAAWNVLQMNRGAQRLALTLTLTLMPWIAHLPKDITLASLRVAHIFAADDPTRAVIEAQVR